MLKPQKISRKPGVYIFRDSHQNSLYIGKAGNLKKRLAFYFSGSPKNPKIYKLLAEATKLETKETSSEIEALIREAELIKKYRPKYNVLMRDDKNYFYVGVTKEKFPSIFITHQLQKIRNPKSEIRNKSQGPNPEKNSNFEFRASNFIKYIGPFTDGHSLKITLKLLRRIFPYCTCKLTHKRPCLNAEIGRCPGFCCNLNQISKISASSGSASGGKNQNLGKIYDQNIRNITEVLNGKKKGLIAELKREMNKAAHGQKYEKAAVLRDQIYGLNKIFEHSKLLEVRPPGGGRTSQNLEIGLRSLLQTKREINRVEGYDISNISGNEAVGSMVVFVKKNGGYLPEKSGYRKFKIKTVRGINDVDMISEVVRRRLNHPEWPYPDLVVIDGGKPQLNAAGSALAKVRKFKYEAHELKVRPPAGGRTLKVGDIKITALAKREEELYTENRKMPIKLKKQPKEILHFFQRVRDEAHRFAQSYHHKRRELKFRRNK